MTAVVDGATETIRLWPDGPPTRIDGVPDEVEYPVRAGVAVGTTFLRNISDPTLTVFTPTEASNGVGVIVVPGGGWTINAWSHEGLDVARWLAGLGYTAFLLKYRVQASACGPGGVRGGDGGDRRRSRGATAEGPEAWSDRRRDLDSRRTSRRVRRVPTTAGARSSSCVSMRSASASRPTPWA